jgi:hypothetical protein
MPHAPLDSHEPSRWQWWVALAFGVLTLGCGTIGVWQYEHEHYGHRDVPSAIYHAVQMLILHSPHLEKGVNGWIEAGRWLGVLAFFTTTAALLWKRLGREFRLLHLSTWSDHHVICGLGHKGFEIASCLKEHNPNARVVVLDPQPDRYLADQCHERGICVITADATQPKALQQARIAQAREIIVATPTDETNVRIATQVQSQRTEKSPLTCHVHLADIHLREALQLWSQTEHSFGPLHFFDVFDNEARRILLTLPLDGSGIGASDSRSVHAVFLGLGRMGRSLVLRAAKMGHFGNSKPLRISIIDRNADQQRERLLFRYPMLAGTQICNLTFQTAEVESRTARNAVEQWAGEPGTLLHVFVCLDDDARAVEVALRLRPILRGNDRNLLVRIHSHESLSSILETAATSVTPFGMIEDVCSEGTFRNEYNEPLARMIHEQFVLERIKDSTRRPETDPTLRPWEDLREDLRESNRQQADHIPIKLRAIGCTLADSSAPELAVTKFEPAEIELLAQMEHARWNAERLLAGWCYGSPSNKEQRISEYIVPWEKLPEPIRDYDRIAVMKIPELLARLKPAQKVIRKSRS